MSRTWILPALLAAFCAVAVAAVGATMTTIGPWYWELAKPEWAPPDALYAVAWTIIYALAALSGVLAWEAAQTRREAETIIGLFALSGFLNIVWSLLFFRLERPDLALIELFGLGASILLLIIYGARIRPVVGLLLVPYFVWVAFAGVLNWEIVQLNGPF